MRMRDKKKFSLSVADRWVKKESEKFFTFAFVVGTTMSPPVGKGQQQKQEEA